VVTRPQIEKLSARIEALAAITDSDSRSAYVWRNSWETKEEALDRHYGQHPEDRSANQTLIFQRAGDMSAMANAGREDAETDRHRKSDIG
jgi:hypothetical protein